MILRRMVLEMLHSEIRRVSAELRNGDIIGSRDYVAGILRGLSIAVDRIEGAGEDEREVLKARPWMERKSEREARRALHCFKHGDRKRGIEILEKLVERIDSARAEVKHAEPQGVEGSE